MGYIRRTKQDHPRQILSSSSAVEELIHSLLVHCCLTEQQQPSVAELLMSWYQIQHISASCLHSDHQPQQRRDQAQQRNHLVLETTLIVTEQQLLHCQIVGNPNQTSLSHP